MPTYLYQIIHEDGREGDLFEWDHPMTERLDTHPQTGEKVRRVYAAPHLGVRYTAGRTRNLLSNENLNAKGFTKYERDKVSGKYHKTAGEGPSVISRPPG